MTKFDWESGLRDWSRKIIERLDDEDKAKLPSEAIASGWLGYPGATEERIKDAEARLGTTLPPSYREFLKVTNGMFYPEQNYMRLYSTEEIEWWCVNDQESIDMWISYWIDEIPSVPDKIYFAYDYSYNCSPSPARHEHLQTALAISNSYEGDFYLLNPQVIATDEEWEAWYFVTKEGGTHRYRSFRDMIEHIINAPESF